MQKKELEFHIYDVDTQINMSFTPVDATSTSVSRMEECFKEIKSWVLINRLNKFDGGKTELLVFLVQTVWAFLELFLNTNYLKTIQEKPRHISQCWWQCNKSQ